MKPLILFIACLPIMAKLSGQSGILDTAYGSGGDLFTTINNSGMAYASAVQPDDKIILAGTALLNSGNSFAAVRYTSNGYLDGSFGGVGILTTHIGPSSGANAIALQADGKIITAGRSLNINGNFDFTLIRQNTDGSLDSTFGQYGIVITDLGADDEITALGLQPDGKILATGFSRTGDSILLLAIVRYNINGTIDSTFARNGTILNSLNINPVVPAPLVRPDCKLQTDGKIVVVSTAFYETNDVLLLRYDSTGMPDQSFGNYGQMAIDFGGNQDFGYALAIQADGKIVAGGASYNTNTNVGYMALCRVNADGTIDSAFGNLGLATPISNSAGAPDARAIYVQSNGNIIVAGNDSNPYNLDYEGFIVAKFQPDGTPNLLFGNNGYNIQALSGTDAIGQGMALQTDGKIIAAGGDGENFISMRFLNLADSVAPVTSVSKYNSPSGAFELQAYPNPSGGPVEVRYLLSANMNVTLQLWNTLGQLMGTFLQNSESLPGIQTQEIDISSLPAGYYLLTLATDDGETSLKLLKQ